MLQISVSRRHLVFLLIAAVVLVVAIPLAVSAATQRFVDVPPTDWAYDDVEWLAANGFTEGCTTDGTEYCPDNPVTRREMAAFMHRLSGNESDTLVGRIDGNSTSIHELELAHIALESTVTSLEADVVSLQSDKDTLQGEVDALTSLLAGVSRDGNVLLFTGMNLQVVNGTTTTDGTPNGLGNLIVGYNAKIAEARTGSHYLVVGDMHEYLGFGGAVIGYGNTAGGDWASVTGGAYSTAAGDYSSVSGGNGNTAGGDYSSVTGGSTNFAGGDYSSVTGGYSNHANGHYSTVLGGSTQTVITDYVHYPPAP